MIRGGETLKIIVNTNIDESEISLFYLIFKGDAASNQLSFKPTFNDEGKMYIELDNNKTSSICSVLRKNVGVVKCQMRCNMKSNSIRISDTINVYVEEQLYPSYQSGVKVNDDKVIELDFHF